MTWKGGFTMVELLTAAMIFTLVGLAMGIYYKFSVQRIEEGTARAELQRNASLVVEVMKAALQGGAGCRIPADGESDEGTSITVWFPPEPFEDEDLDGKWDRRGATGPCAPQECFQDLNGNGKWDREVQPTRSFRLFGSRLQCREDDKDWEDFLDDRYPEPEASSVRMDELQFYWDEENPILLHIHFVLRDDRRTPEEENDDLVQSYRFHVRLRG